MTHWVGQYFLLALLAGMFVLSYFILQPFLTALVLAAVFAVVLQPLYRNACAMMPRWPSVASFLTVLLSVVCVVVPLMFVGTKVGQQATELYVSLVYGNGQARISSAMMSLESLLTSYVPAARGISEQLTSNIATYGESALRWFLLNLGAAFSGIASLLLSLFIFFVALYYLLRDGARLKERIVALSPLRDSYDESVFERLEIAVNSVVRGTLAIALVQGFLAGLGFWFFGVPNGVLWGTVAAIAALIPAVGTGLVFVPTIVFLAATGSIGAAIGLSVWGLVVVGGMDNLLRPYFIGSGIKMHPLLVLLSVLGGITFFGPIGIFLGPIALSLLFALLSIYMDISQRAL
jgi:predicted PurR-regulated permease PerM